MKKMLIGLAILISALVSGANAQEPAAFPSCNLDMKKMVDILADYDVEHQSAIAGGEYWGLTNTHTRKMYL